MKNNILVLITLAALLTACGTTKQAATSTLPHGQTTTGTTTQEADPFDAVMATLGEWQTLQTGGNITIQAGSKFSSSVQVKMVRDQAISISLRPMLGIEVGRLVITADSLLAVDKVHKRYIAEKVSILTAGVPVTVSDVQDIFLGRPFILGKGTLNTELKTEMTATREGNTIVLSPTEQYRGYSYAFTYDKTTRLISLDILPAGSTTAAYQVKYSDVRGTKAGNIAHAVNVNANVDKKKLAFSLTYKGIEWNGDVKYDRSLPSGYKRMSAADLFSIFAN